METFAKLFGSLLALVYRCFDRVVILGHLPCSPARRTSKDPAFPTREGLYNILLSTTISAAGAPSED